MRTWLAPAAFQGCRAVSGFLIDAMKKNLVKKVFALGALLTFGAVSAFAQPEAGGEAALKLPDLSSVSFLNGAIDGHKLLLIGILFCIFGLGFGLVIYMRLKNLPVHRSMREISELTGWSESNVKVRAFRARQNLKKILETSHER